MSRRAGVLVSAVAMAVASAVAMAVASAVGWAADAATVKIDPGLWRVTQTVENSMLPQPRTTADTHCIRESEFDPVASMGDGNGCRVTSHKKSATSLEWNMQCRAPQGPPMQGEGRMTSHGERFEGQMTMSGNFGGHQMSVTTRWKGERTGPCPA